MQVIGVVNAVPSVGYNLKISFECACLIAAEILNQKICNDDFVLWNAIILEKAWKIKKQQQQKVSYFVSFCFSVKSP